MIQKKICMLGSPAVGKTSLVRRFVTSLYGEVYHTTIGVKVDKKTAQVAGQEVMLVLWDIHGEDVYQKQNMSYLRGMSGYLMVVDGTRRQTLDEALALNERVVLQMGKVPALLLLNKFDLSDQWEIDPSQTSKLGAAGWNVLHTSAKTGEHVEEAFLQLAAMTLKE
jgi:hypothetical protein